MQWCPSCSTAFGINHITPCIADLHLQKITFCQVTVLLYKVSISTLFLQFVCSVINTTV